MAFYFAFLLCLFFLTKKRSKANFSPDMDLSIDLNTSLHQKLSHKKLVATASCRECVCNRTSEPSVTFCEKGGARKWADVFLDKEKRSKANFAPTW